ncbi:MAG: GNAT family N-acetyltransferase, partial [Chloroflexota bacterium]
MVIERVVVVTPELLEAFNRLIPQLTDNSPPPGADDLDSILMSDSSVVLIAREPDARGQIVGAGCLAIYRAPTGIRVVIEDVVVDQYSRGLGVGEALMRHLMEVARQRGARGVSLTSNPRREAA